MIWAIIWKIKQTNRRISIYPWPIILIFYHFIHWLTCLLFVYEFKKWSLCHLSRLNLSFFSLLFRIFFVNKNIFNQNISWFFAQKYSVFFQNISWIFPRNIRSFSRIFHDFLATNIWVFCLNISWILPRNTKKEKKP